MTSLVDEFLKRSNRPHMDIAIWDGAEVTKLSVGSKVVSQADVFEIGSISKTLTTTLLAVLVKDGAVFLDDTVGKFKPNLFALKEVTLEQLASHTSGLETNPFNGLIFLPSQLKKRMQNWQKEDLEQYLLGIKKPLRAGKFRYSNTGMALLGDILSSCVNKPYEQAVREYILEPLKMHDTHISLEHYDAKRLVVGHSNNKVEPPFCWENIEPAGLWRSTSSDMMTFLQAQLGNFGDYWRDIAIKTTQSLTNNTKVKKVGLGWMLTDIENIGATAWHNGRTFGQHSMCVWAREKNAAIIILTNNVAPIWHGFFESRSLECLAFRLLSQLKRPI